MKKILVTGASSGIGAACAKHLAGEGHDLVLMARREDRLQSLKEDIVNSGGKAHVYLCDVTDFSKVKSSVDHIVSDVGGIDVVVNNAGLMPLSFLKNGKVEEGARMVDVNIKGVMHLTYAVLPHMLEKNSGHFINISSVASKIVMAGGAIYSGTKFFVRAFTEGLRAEMAMYGKNIRVTDIQPGATASELMNSITDADVGEYYSKMQFEFLSADDIARGVSYAISQPDNVNVNEILIRPLMQPL